MKRIDVSLSLVTLCICFCCHARQHGNTASRAEAVGAGQQKLICPGSKSQLPYLHFVSAGLQDKVGGYWFATSEGVYHYDGQSFVNYKQMDGLNTAGDVVKNIVEDRAGNIWFGSVSGAARYNAPASPGAGAASFTSVPMPAMDGAGNIASIPTAVTTRNNDGSTPDPFVSVFPDRSGNVWFCYGFDLLRYDERSRAAVPTGLGNYLKNELFPNTVTRRDATIHHLYQDKKGNIWFTISGCSTPLHESYRLEGRGLGNPCVLGTCKHDPHDPQQHAAHNKEITTLLTRVTKEDGITGIAYIAVLEDKNGNMWYGTYDSGVYLCNAQASLRKGALSVVNFSGKDGLASSAVSAIYEDKAGNIWFGTGDRNQNEGNGVFRCHPTSQESNRSLTHFTTKNGLCNTGTFRNNIVTSITEDNAGKIWFAGQGGVCSYDPSGALKTGSNLFANLTKKDGFNEQPVNFIMKDKAGNMWMGTWEMGLYRYRPSATLRAGAPSLTNYTEKADEQ